MNFLYKKLVAVPNPESTDMFGLIRKWYDEVLKGTRLSDKKMGGVMFGRTRKTVPSLEFMTLTHLLRSGYNLEDLPPCASIPCLSDHSLLAREYNEFIAFKGDKIMLVFHLKNNGGEMGYTSDPLKKRLDLFSLFHIEKTNPPKAGQMVILCDAREIPKDYMQLFMSYVKTGSYGDFSALKFSELKRFYLFSVKHRMRHLQLAIKKTLLSYLENLKCTEEDKERLVEIVEFLKAHKMTALYRRAFRESMWLEIIDPELESAVITLNKGYECEESNHHEWSDSREHVSNRLKNNYLCGEVFDFKIRDIIFHICNSGLKGDDLEYCLVMGPYLPDYALSAYEINEISKLKSTEVMQLLLKHGLSFQNRAVSGWDSPLISSGNVEMVQLFFENGLSIINHSPGLESVHPLVRLGKPENMRLFLAHGMSLPKKSINYDRDALLSTYRDNLEMLNLLLENGLTFYPHCFDGDDICSIIKHGKTPMMRRLLESGVSLSSIVLNEDDILKIITLENTDMVRLLVEYQPCLFNVSISISKLCNATQLINAGMLQLLLENKLSFSGDLSSAKLCKIAKPKNMYILQFLFKSRKSLNWVSLSGSQLCEIVKSNSIDMLKLLLENRLLLSRVSLSGSQVCEIARSVDANMLQLLFENELSLSNVNFKGHEIGEMFATCEPDIIKLLLTHFRSLHKPVPGKASSADE